jgi:hypothetical protein
VTSIVNPHQAVGKGSCQSGCLITPSPSLPIGCPPLNPISTARMLPPGMGLSFLGRRFKDYMVVSHLCHLRKCFFSDLLHYLHRNLLEMRFRRSHSTLLLVVTPNPSRRGVMRAISFGNRHLPLAGRKMFIFRYLYPPLSSASFRHGPESVLVFYGTSFYLHTSLRYRTICVTLV